MESQSIYSNRAVKYSNKAVSRPVCHMPTHVFIYIQLFERLSENEKYKGVRITEDSLYCYGSSSKMILFIHANWALTF